MSRNQRQTNIDCRYFANGICSKGNACTYRHDVAVRNQNICQFNFEGKCSFGQACRFKHQRPSGTDLPPDCNFSRPPPPLPSGTGSGSTVTPSTVSTTVTRGPERSLEFIGCITSGGGPPCQFIRPSGNPGSSAPGPSTSSSSSSTTTNPHRVRPVQLAKPGLNVGAVEFVPTWLKKNVEEPAAPQQTTSVVAPKMSYAAAAKSGVPTTSSTSSTSTVASEVQYPSSTTVTRGPAPNPLKDATLCPYWVKKGECHREGHDCPFAHGDKCDLCNQWSLHPINQELRKKHQQDCTKKHHAEMERAFLLQKTEEKTCGICMENIYEKNLRFGILNGCQHCFCLVCIRQWRTQDQKAMELATKTVRGCPECRQHSDYVIPSMFWVEKGEEKDLLIQMYKENTKSKVCKYYASVSKRGNCPFGNKCFYKHQLPDGSVDPGESPHARRRPRISSYIFDNDSDNEYDFDGPDDELEFQRYIAEMEAGSEEGEFFRAVTAMIQDLRGDEFRRRYGL